MKRKKKIKHVKREAESVSREVHSVKSKVPGIHPGTIDRGELEEEMICETFAHGDTVPVKEPSIAREIIVTTLLLAVVLAGLLWRMGLFG